MLAWITQFVDFFLHLDRHLSDLIAQYGNLTYALLFAIVFAETGLVVTPFLPGDSLLFAAGALAATGVLDIKILVVVLLLAAVMGVQVNYHVGRYVGPKVFSRSYGRLLRREHLESARIFCERHGAKAVVLSRFLPIVRTCAPFVIGIGRMEYLKFTLFNALGGIIWVSLFVAGGYAFGNLPVVKENFSLVVLGIILVTVAPVIYGAWRERRRGASAAATKISAAGS